MEALRLEVYVRPRKDESFAVDIHADDEAFVASEIVYSLDEVGDLVADCFNDRLFPEEVL